MAGLTSSRTSRCGRLAAPPVVSIWSWQAPPPLLAGFPLEALGKVGRGLSELALVALAIATAILVALPTVVTDDTFGTWRDYLVALGLGGAAVVAAKGIVDLIAQMIKRARV